MYKFITCLLPFFCGTLLYAQTDGAYYVSRDFSTWTSATFNLKFSKAWSLSLTQDLRLKTNSSEFDLTFTELKTKYKFDNGLYFGVGYRFIIDRTENSNERDLEQRFLADLGYTFDYKRFEFDTRLRWQSTDDLGENKTDDGDYARRALRLKFQTQYDIKKFKFDPILSAEIFRANGQNINPNFNKFRITLGTNYNFKKAGEIEAFYGIEKEINTNYGLTEFIFGFNYKFNWKTYKNDEQK